MMKGGREGVVEWWRGQRGVVESDGWGEGGMGNDGGGRDGEWWRGGCWAVIVRGHSSLFLGAELSIVGAGARLRERIVRSCWFVVCGRGCAVWSPLARLNGEGGTHRQWSCKQRRTTTLLSFVVWLPRRWERRGTCKPPACLSRSVVTWRWWCLLWWL